MMSPPLLLSEPIRIQQMLAVFASYHGNWVSNILRYRDASEQHSKSQPYKPRSMDTVLQHVPTKWCTLHGVREIQQLLRRHFVKNHIIICSFPTR
ncbi:hypothetical protein NPIL_631871 [Nephila pilipes]|uniref:Uncharacterized protein n=1 Tax=Nephila pilipes TaxID=299642 RepID=A0A8X6TXR9_NEPPI|nr:hypothetical protein NPIL_631871 [Nephila pilipes]